MSCNGIKVLIAAPLKQEPKIFREYQDALDPPVYGTALSRFFEEARLWLKIRF